MLTPEYLQQITEKAENMTAKLREDIVRIMVERYLARMKREEESKVIPSDRMLAETLQAAGVLFRDVVKIVRNYTGESDRIVRKMFQDAGVKALKFEDKEYRKVGLENDGSNMSPAVKRIINRNYKATDGTMQNITGTLATETQKTFINVCSQSLFEMQTGAKSLSQAYLDAIEKIAEEGGYIEYDSGRRDTVETAVLRALRTGLTQTSAEITIDRAKELEYDLVLVSAHMGARINPHDKIANHAGWQGQVYSISGETKEYEKLEDATGYPSNPLGLCGYNCRHNITIFIQGISKNPYRDKKGNLLLDSEENKEKYEQEQKARRMERGIRESKIKKQALTAAYENTDGEEREEIGKELRKIKQRLGEQNTKYREYMDEHGMKPQDYRVKVAIRDIENKANTLSVPSIIGDEKKFIQRNLDKFANVLDKNEKNSLFVRNLKLYSEQTEWIEDKTLDTAFMYSPNQDAILYNSEDRYFEVYDQNYVISHELTHRMDISQYHSWENEGFVSAIENGKRVIYNKQIRDEIQAWFMENGKYEYHAAISDIIGAVTENEVCPMITHDTKYWNTYTKPLEVFANMSSIYVLQDEAIFELKRYFGDIYNAFMELIGE